MTCGRFGRLFMDWKLSSPARAPGHINHLVSYGFPACTCQISLLRLCDKCGCFLVISQVLLCFAKSGHNFPRLYSLFGVILGLMAVVPKVDSSAFARHCLSTLLLKLCISTRQTPSVIVWTTLASHLCEKYASSAVRHREICL